MAETLETCRFCGAPGLESEDDPAPGVCPRCLDERMARATANLEKVAAAYRAGEITGESLFGWSRALLLGAGLTRAAADRLIDASVAPVRERERPPGLWDPWESPPP
ncbi:MAG TPA: hypothetical protein VKG45_03780 [Actinomycetes bacterium]|nr:hypothetical protein [Actinomycetes bacterium]